MAFLSKIKQYLQQDLRWSDEVHWLTISHIISCFNGLKLLYSPIFAKTYKKHIFFVCLSWGNLSRKSKVMFSKYVAYIFMLIIKLIPNHLFYQNLYIYLRYLPVHVTVIYRYNLTYIFHPKQ